MCHYYVGDLGMPTTAVMIETLIKMRQEPGGIPLDQFWYLLERFRADLVNQALAITGQQADAEDVAQETLCKAFLDLSELRDPAKLGHWLRHINRIQALNLRRQRVRSKEERLATGQLNALEAGEGEALPRTAPEQELNEHVVRAVDSLPEGFREVVVLRYWEKLSNEEIATRLGLPEGTVRSRMARADRLLAERLRTFIKQEEHQK